MLRCRENDLAIILRGPYLGFTVTVGKVLGTETGTAPDGRTITETDVWVVHCDAIPLSPRATRVAATDRNIQPIRGLRKDQTTTTEKEMRA